VWKQLQTTCFSNRRLHGGVVHGRSSCGRGPSAVVLLWRREWARAREIIRHRAAHIAGDRALRAGGWTRWNWDLEMSGCEPQGRSKSKPGRRLGVSKFNCWWQSWQTLLKHQRKLGRPVWPTITTKAHLRCPASVTSFLAAQESDPMDIYIYCATYIRSALRKGSFRVLPRVYSRVEAVANQQAPNKHVSRTCSVGVLARQPMAVSYF
jgi:hypothetical protein